jgi:hypothetical protein
MIDNQIATEITRPDRKKSHQELTLEIEELKKRKNREIEDIKKLKVELHKMEHLYKKCKEIVSAGGMQVSSLANFNLAGMLPFSLGQPNEV